MPAEQIFEDDVAAALQGIDFIRQHHAKVMGAVSHAELMLKAYTGAIADDEHPAVPAGDPEWLRRVIATLIRADEAADLLIAEIDKTRLEVRKLI